MQYYFLPVWVSASPDGGLLFQVFQRRLIEVAELPPSTFVLSDPLLIVLSIAFAFLARKALRKAGPDFPLASAAMTGLAVPAVLMLIAISMCFRYRMEFYSLFDTAALFVLLRLRKFGKNGWLVPVLGVIIIVGIVSAHVSLLLYKLSPFGAVTDAEVSHGWTGVYVQQALIYYPTLGRLVADWVH